MSGSVSELFIPKHNGQARLALRATWQQRQGFWTDHPVSHGMPICDVIVWLRGEEVTFRMSLDSSILISHLADDVHIVMHYCIACQECMTVSGVTVGDN